LAERLPTEKGFWRNHARSSCPDPGATILLRGHGSGVEAAISRAAVSVISFDGDEDDTPKDYLQI
jgi:hypothetical protein